MIPRDPQHYLKALKTTRTPKRLAFFDCDTVSAREGGAWVERWKSGAVITSLYNKDADRWSDHNSVHDSPEELWQAVTAFCAVGRRVVLWGFDLTVQLRISRALVELPKLGWSLDRIVLERGAAWASFKMGARSLMIADLRTWMGTDWNGLRRLFNNSHAAYNVARQEQAIPLCQTMANCTVQRAIVLVILRFIDREDLGPFRPTASGQSYGAFRKRFLDHRMMVHDDYERLKLERRAMWTGRCEAWRHGTLTDGPYVEYDMAQAYCRIAATASVPTVARGCVDDPTTKRLRQLMGRFAVLAECEVRTETPCVPTAAGQRTVWPVGHFRTVLWDPEIELALTYGDDVKVTRAWCYDRAPALRSFSQWVLDMLHDDTGKVGAVERKLLKHWSRCLVGRLGLRYRAWQHFGTDDHADVRIITYLDHDEGIRTEMLHAGYDLLILSEMEESPESMPQVPGWVMSKCRANLWDTMTANSLDKVVYCDTDSVLWQGEPERPWGGEPWWPDNTAWVRKGTHNRVTIHGPRNLVVETDRRISGLPLTAQQTAPLEYDGVIMRSIRESMKGGQLDHVASIPRTFRFHAPDLRRQHQPDGTTLPYRMDIQDA